MNAPSTQPLSPETLNSTLSEHWPHGAIESVIATRIGEDFGFGGYVYRLDMTTDTGPHTLVAKEESPEQVERVVRAYQHMGDVLNGRVPRLYGWGEDITLFEFVAPAQQGDGLDVHPQQVETMLRLLADMHAATWSNHGPSWLPEHWDDERWEYRLTRARGRYPDRMGDAMLDRLRRLHDEIPPAIAALERGPSSLIHGDSVFDNTLWRDDGSIVLLDWSNSRLGPPTVDLAAHLAHPGPVDVVSIYLDALHDNDVTITGEELTASLINAVRLDIRGMVGFAGLAEEPTQSRLLRFRDIALDTVAANLNWLDGQGSSNA